LGNLEGFGEVFNDNLRHGHLYRSEYRMIKRLGGDIGQNIRQVSEGVCFGMAFFLQSNYLR